MDSKIVLCKLMSRSNTPTYINPKEITNVVIDGSTNAHAVITLSSGEQFGLTSFEWEEIHDMCDIVLVG